MIEKAKEIVEQRSITNFSGSHGRLDKWKHQFNIKQMKVCGKSGDVQGILLIRGRNDFQKY